MLPRAALAEGRSVMENNRTGAAGMDVLAPTTPHPKQLKEGELRFWRSICHSLEEAQSTTLKSAVLAGLQPQNEAQG